MTNISSKHSINIVICTTFTSLLGMPIIGPSLPIVQAEFFISNRDIGWMLMSSYTFPALFFIPITGYLADRYGKKNVILPSLFIFGLSGSLISMAPNTEILITLRFFQGLGGSALVTLCTALIPDLFSGRDKVRMMGYAGATQGIGAGLLPLLGGILASITWYLPFVTAFIAIPVGIYLLFYLDDLRPNENPEISKYIKYAINNLANRQVFELCFFSFGFIFIGFGAFISYVPSFMNTTFGSGSVLIGIIVASRALTGTATSYFLNQIMASIPSRTLVAGAFALLTIGMIAIPFFQNIWGVVICALFYGAGFGIIRPLIQVHLFEIAPKNLRATFSSANGTAIRIAQTLSPFIAGITISVSGFNTLYILAACFSGCMLVLALFGTSLTPENTQIN